MATLNPVKSQVNVDSSRHSTRQVVQYVGRITGGGAHDVTVETKLKKVMSAVVVNETDHVLLTPTIAASTAYSGSEKVTFTVANEKTYSYIITGLLSRTNTVDTTGGATTITCNPINID